jgi:SAM-dependent methyltransferase
MAIESDWWQGFFDADYPRLWGGFTDAARTEREVGELWDLLGLHAGTRVLDAPCGYGRITVGLAGRGAVVLGVDFAAALVDEAERRRGAISRERLQYQQHDLRQTLRSTSSRHSDTASNRMMPPFSRRCAMPCAPAGECSSRPCTVIRR